MRCPPCTRPSAPPTPSHLHAAPVPAWHVATPTAPSKSGIQLSILHLPACLLACPPPALQDGNYVEFKSDDVEDAWADGLASAWAAQLPHLPLWLAQRCRLLCGALAGLYSVAWLSSPCPFCRASGGGAIARLAPASLTPATLARLASAGVQMWRWTRSG